MFKKIIEKVLQQTSIIPFHVHCSKCQRPVVYTTHSNSIFDENEKAICETCIRIAGIKSLIKK